ncbi:hypothetical protein [Rhodococcus koreensis]
MAFRDRVAIFACGLLAFSSFGVFSCVIEDSLDGAVFYSVTLIPSGDLLLRRLREMHSMRRQVPRADHRPTPEGLPHMHTDPAQLNM